VVRLQASADGSGKVVEQHLPLFKIKKSDQLLIKAGQVIPADGKVLAGHSSVNEAQFTGEFQPQTKVAGDHVVAGTINGNGVLTIEVESIGADTQLQLINELLSRAQSHKPQIAQLADRFAGYFIAAVLSLALASYLFWHYANGGQQADKAFWIMLSVLVVSCPCALSLATPAALTAATNRLRSLGMLVTEPQVWEKMPAVSHVVCDKTGTLTRGELSLAAIKPVAGLDQQQCLEIAVALEQFSEHPIGRAFGTVHVASAVVSDVSIAIGEGLQACVDGECYRIGRSEYAAALYGQHNQSAPDNGQWILLSHKAGPLCWFQLRDGLREDAHQLVAGLRQQKLAIHLLSGDSSAAVQELSQALNLDHYIAGASPQDKMDYIRALQQQGATVLMLGDGINDIPVLAAADISVAMANASNLAKTHADGILLSGQLTTVLYLMQLAVQTRRIIRQNIVWALAYNALMIPLAAMGWIPPYVAALGMSLSSLVVVFNALHLQRRQQPKPFPMMRLAPAAGRL
jgi:Cu2+-exporting ATPase